MFDRSVSGVGADLKTHVGNHGPSIEVRPHLQLAPITIRKSFHRLALKDSRIRDNDMSWA